MIDAQDTDLDAAALDAEAPPVELDATGEVDDTGVVVEIGGDDADDEGAPEWVKNLRRENRELRKQVKATQTATAVAQVVPLPPKPTLEGCDYETAAFEAKLEEWYEAKREHDARETTQRSEAERAEQQWTERLQQYDTAKAAIAPDFDDVEAVALDILDKPIVINGTPVADGRVGIIKHAAKNAPMLMYALGRNPERAQALAAIDDPGAFVFALGEFSGRIKVVNNTKAPAPERKVSGTVPGVRGAVDNTLERLREEAAKTGDFSKVVKYKKEKAR